MESIVEEENSDDLVTIICKDFTFTNLDEKSKLYMLSTNCISGWDLSSILPCKLIKIKANPNRLVEESSYFRGLLSGSFSESGLDEITIEWDVGLFVSVLRFVFGCGVDISAVNFVPLNEAALFFGVERLLLKCQAWLEEVTEKEGIQSPQLCLDDLIHIWKYGFEHANDFILLQCTSYLARNFMRASSFDSFNNMPDKFLISCISDPDLTVESERHLCDAILVWLTANTAKPEGWRDNAEYEKVCIEQIRGALLPMWFAAGKKRCSFFSKVTSGATATISTLNKYSHTGLTDISRKDDFNHLKIRLTKYTEKLDLSGCPQITPKVFLLSMFPSSFEDSMLRKIIEKYSVNPTNIGEALKHSLTFEAVRELDISNCPSFSLDSAVDCLCKLFPSLRKLKAAYLSNFSTTMLCQLVGKFPSLNSLDLTLDINPVFSAHASVISSSSTVPKTQYNHSAHSFFYTSRVISVSNIKKLILEGRNDISDSDLKYISETCMHLNYVNIRGCKSVTDHGIAEMILTCKKLKSVLACDTYFGNSSITALCSGDSSELILREKQSRLPAYRLLDLHIGGCYGIDGEVLSKLMSESDSLRTLCLREIESVDIALHGFSGTSLEMLDMSDTKVCGKALCHVIRRNPDLKCIKTRGCTNLSQTGIESKSRKLCGALFSPMELYSELGNSCKLEEIEFGWGFSFMSIEALTPAIRALRSITIGLGGALGQDGLKLLPTVCPLLETLILYFQELSHSGIANITKALPRLQSLSLCYCFGDISPIGFILELPYLRNLKLERVTPSITNRELATLAQNCACLTELSLIGCALLNSESQDIISSCWPGLISLHLEECGEITANGVGSLLDCQALEDLRLRHTGAGIPRNFISHAASKLPMLRKVSLDMCDAKEHDFDIPSFADRYFLSTVTISRCKLQKCSIGLHFLETRKTPVHKESLVLTWNNKKLVRTVVKERL